MDPAVAAALGSWSFDPWILLALGAVTLAYLRGFAALHRRHPERLPRWRRAAFLTGIGAFLLAVASPIDAFADFLLQVHMAQHLLLMGVVPPLLWLGAPQNPVLQGLPRSLLKEGLGPFLQWRGLRRAAGVLVHPVTAWLAFAATTWIWHAPPLYQLALRSPFWHDVEHLCFLGAALLFWFPVVQPWPSRPVWPRAAMLPYLALAGVQITAFSALFAFSGRLFYPAYADLPRLWGISALDDQAAAGAVMWVVSALVLLVAVVGVGVTMLEPSRARSPRAPAPAAPRRVSPDRLRARFPRGWLASPGFRRAAQVLLLGLAVAVVLDGLLGPSTASSNLAGVLPWTWWRGLVVIGLLLAGNLFCFACPFTLPRGLALRLLGGRRPRPGLLRSKWGAVGLLALYLVAYEVFDLWASPWWTAWIALGYFAAAFAVDGLYGGASFCRSLCPIGQFQFLGSAVSPLEVAPRDAATCARCSSHDCLRGGPAGPGCQLDLFQPSKLGNLDCTFCLDCVRACPHDNVGLRPRWPGRELVPDARRAGIGRLGARPDLAALALLFCFGAFVNAAAMVEPVVAWERSAARGLGVASERGWTALVLGVSLIGLPLLATVLAGRAGSALSRLRLRGDARRQLVRRFGLALVPLGFGMWLAHYSFHLATAGGALASVAARLTRARPVEMAAASLAPLDSLLPLEITALGLGLWVTVFVAWRIALDAAGAWRPALGLLAPWLVLAVALWGAGLWTLFQPMEMRGMGTGMGMG